MNIEKKITLTSEEIETAIDHFVRLLVDKPIKDVVVNVGFDVEGFKQATVTFKEIHETKEADTSREDLGADCIPISKLGIKNELIKKVDKLEEEVRVQVGNIHDTATTVVKVAGRVGALEQRVLGIRMADLLNRVEKFEGDVKDHNVMISRMMGILGIKKHEMVTVESGSGKVADTITEAHKRLVSKGWKMNDAGYFSHDKLKGQDCILRVAMETQEEWDKTSGSGKEDKCAGCVKDTKENLHSVFCQNCAADIYRAIREREKNLRR